MIVSECFRLFFVAIWLKGLKCEASHKCWRADGTVYVQMLETSPPRSSRERDVAFVVVLEGFRVSFVGSKVRRVEM